jgi:U3 small nucleolar RNA-associated protein 12
MIHPLASLPLAVRSRVSQIAFHPTQSYLAVQSHDRSVEIFRVRTEEEARKKQARRKKREKEKVKNKKLEEDSKQDDNEEKLVGLEDLFTPYLVVRGSGKIRSFSFADEEPGPRGEIQVRICIRC